MPTTLAGDYLKETEDLRSAGITERTIIVACDATGTLVATAKTFSALTPEQLGVIVAEANAVIAVAESELNSYADRRGYLTPVAPVSPTVRDLAARIAAVMFNLRAKAITAVEAESQRNALRSGSLKDIAEGRLPLVGATLRSSPTSAQSSCIYRYSDAASRDTTGQTWRASRESLRRY